MASMKWLILMACLGLGAGACIPTGGGGGGDDDDGGDPGPEDMFVDPDDGVPPVDMFIDPDDGVPPQDMFIDPDDGVPPVDRGVDPDGERCGPELCNGEDDDCDGVADEDFPELGGPCRLPAMGVCDVEGQLLCIPDGSGLFCEIFPPEPTGEECNGRDDDCDGTTDEDVMPRPCDAGGGGRCGPGLEQCVDGEMLCVPQLDPVPEACNGEDDDCDGVVDEDIGVRLCRTGLPGQCADGDELCVDGEVVCQPNTVPMDEQCGARDRDCDGRVDEGGVCEACFGVECPAGSFCENGECVAADPCAGVMCAPGSVCRQGACVPVGPDDALPIAAVGGDIVIDGALTVDDRRWQRLAQGCAGRSAGDFYFDAVRVINLTGAAARITTTGDWAGADGFLHVFADNFDPALDAGCLGGDDDFGNTMRSQVPDVIIPAGAVRVLVVSTYSAGDVMDYTLTVETTPCVDDPACDAPVEGDECQAYFEVDDAGRNIGRPDGQQCDQLNRGSTVTFGEWNRFLPPAGTQLPEAPPPTNTCGTDAPGWLQSGHPAVADGIVPGTVCFHWAGDPCQWSVDVEVRNCGGFYVYRLPTTPACTLQYCVE